MVPPLHESLPGDELPLEEVKRRFWELQQEVGAVSAVELDCFCWLLLGAACTPMGTCNRILILPLLP